jgi:alpha-tubulin suppressor-like RCC1 family protein
LQVPGQLDALEIEVSKDSQTGSEPWLRPTALREGMLPLSLALNSEHGKTPWVEVRVRGTLRVGQGGVLTVVERSARARFQRGKTLELRVELLRDCAATIAQGEIVQAATHCGDGLTCGEGGSCEDPTRSSLPAYAGLPEKRPISTSDASIDGGVRDAQVDLPPADAAVDAQMPAPDDPESVIGLALGTGHSCALKASGSVYCWGSNKSSALGRSFESDATCPEGSICRTPRRVPKLYQIVSVGAGDQFACALDAFESVHCWGDNSYGQLGRTVTDKLLAEPEIVYKHARALAVGKTFVCVLDVDSNVRCWGDDSRSQTGSPVPEEERTIPNRVLQGAGTIALGASHGCAGLRSDGGLVCWGDINAMELGLTTPSQSREALPLGAQPTQLSLGGGHTCFTTAAQANRILCVGRAQESQLGPNAHLPLDSCPDLDAPAGVSNFGCTSKLVPVDVGAPPLALALGEHFSCALLDDEHKGVSGRVACWGDNDWGQINGSASHTLSTPQNIAVPASVQVLAAGARHACAAWGRSISCWGANDAGQLGNEANDAGQRTTPVKVTLPSD